MSLHPDNGLGILIAALAARMCPLCARDVPHHTNAASSISGADRHIVWDLHAVEDTGGVGLAECTAYPLFRALETGR